jgi:hypothetical protein
MNIQEHLDSLSKAEKRVLKGLLSHLQQQLVQTRRRALAVESRLGARAWHVMTKRLSGNSPPSSEDEAVNMVAESLAKNGLRGPSIQSRPKLLGRAMMPQKMTRVLQKARKGRVSKRHAIPPLSDITRAELIMLVQKHDEIVGMPLLRPPVWATFNERDHTTDPFAGIHSPAALSSLLALNWDDEREALLIIYQPHARKALRFPTLADAVWAYDDQNGIRRTGWHPYFLPAPPASPCGRSKPVGRYRRQKGRPELVHDHLPSSDIEDVRVLP